MKPHEFTNLIKKCKTQEVILALEQNVSLVNAISDEGYSALSIAIYRLEDLKEAEQVARFSILCNLLDKGADPSQEDKNGFNFLQNNVYSCAYKTVNTRKKGLSWKAAPEAYKTVAQFHEDVVKYLLNNLNNLALSNKGKNPANATQEEKIKYFLTDSFCTLVTPADGDLKLKPYSCLNLAVWAGRPSLCNIIMQHSPNLAPIPANPITCVHESLLLLLDDENDADLCLTRFTILNELLVKLSHDANNLQLIINSPCTGDYETAIKHNIVFRIWANIKGDKVGKTYNALNDTPLHTAVRYGNTDSKIAILIYKLLYAFGANLSAENQAHKTPEQLARALHKDRAETLLKNFPLDELKNKSTNEIEAVRAQLSQLESLAETLKQRNTVNIDSEVELLNQKIAALKSQVQQLTPQPSHASLQQESNYGVFGVPPLPEPESEYGIFPPEKSVEEIAAGPNSSASQPSVKSEYDVVPPEIADPAASASGNDAHTIHPPQPPVPPSMPVAKPTVNPTDNASSSSTSASNSTESTALSTRPLPFNSAALASAAEKLKPSKTKLNVDSSTGNPAADDILRLLSLTLKVRRPAIEGPTVQSDDNDWDEDDGLKHEDVTHAGKEAAETMHRPK